MAKRDEKLYDRLRKGGVRKKVATRVSEALPRKGAQKPSTAKRVADQLSGAAESIRDRANVAKRRSAPRKRTKARKN